MSALMNSIGLSNDNTSVTKISANARIDYILRFSKQAILVIDESVEQNAQITNQFIATIPENHNIAYVALSSQFNDIQIRCRIVEQLSAGELFDPELSLAVSIINLAKASKQSISIVLDNTQNLSLQILHEVTQLTLIAKKANLVINVIMFGSAQAGCKVQANQSLFHQKLTLLSAQSGQLLSATSALFNQPKIKWYASKLNKLLLIAFTLLSCFAVAVVILLQQDSFNFTAPLKVDNAPEVTLSSVITTPQPRVIEKKTVNITAQPNDILLSLTAGHESSIANEPVVEDIPATPNDIVHAITLLSSDEIVDTAINLEVSPNTSHHSLNAVNKAVETKKVVATSINVDNNYYLNQESGFVIQIAAFSDINLPEAFMKNLASVDYQVYQRLLNDKVTFVITSTLYQDKFSAKQALSAMPEDILARQPWIKSINVINSEINAFLVSQ